MMDALHLDTKPHCEHAAPESGQSRSHGPLEKTGKESPAYVAPISPIPKIQAFGHVGPRENGFRATGNPSGTLPIQEPQSKIQIVGKKVDEYGDILDENGLLLARVEGDLPSMFGRPVSNARGDVLGDDGERLGWVTEVVTGQGQKIQTETQNPTLSLEEATKAMVAADTAPGGLRVDLLGNILDVGGNIVGSFRDNISGFGTQQLPDHGESGKSGKSETVNTEACPQSYAWTQSLPHRKKTDDKAGSSPQAEARENAQAHRKQPEARKESPSDVFLDVKSTNEGIQLTIRIPTVFNAGGQPLQPKIVFQ